MLNTLKSLSLVTTGITSILVLSGVTASSAALITDQLVLQLDASTGVTTDFYNKYYLLFWYCFFKTRMLP